MEHLGMDVRGGLEGRLPVWWLFQKTGLPNVLQVTAEKGTLRSLGFPILSQHGLGYISYIRSDRSHSPKPILRLTYHRAPRTKGA